MFQKQKIIIAISMAIAVAGCSKNEPITQEQAVADAVTETPSATPASSTGEQIIKGYKSFLFGMAAVDVVKLPECINGFKEAYAPVADPLDEQKLAALKNAPADDDFKRATAQRIIDAYEAEQANAPSVELSVANLHRSLTREEVREKGIAKQKKYDYEQSKQIIEKLSDPNHIDQNKSAIAALESKTASLIAQKEDLANFAPYLVAKWESEGTCAIEFMGDNISLKPLFREDKLTAVELNVGQFNGDKYRALEKSLSEKYAVTAEVSDEQRSAFNQMQLDSVVSTFANGQVALYAKNEINIQASLGYDIPLKERVIVLVYADQSEASSINKDANKGKAVASDL